MATDYLFTFGTGKQDIAPDAQAMGTKGANVASMAALGLPVPPGFVLATALGRQVLADDGVLPDHVMLTVRAALQDLETALQRTFGGQERPLLVSVRSGAAVSMPGMMDTVLNLGLNDQTVMALARDTGDARFAWDTYRRFIQSFANVVLGVDDDRFEEILEDYRARHDCEVDSELPDTALEAIVARFQDLVSNEAGQRFPQDVFQQLELALKAVFSSRNTPRAIRYRDINKLDHEGGTAAIVQTMVFGNRDPQSCTGVYFTRNPSTGEKKPYGEYMVNAQGEDVVSGVRTPYELTEESRIRAMSNTPSMEKLFPKAFDELVKIGGSLESHFGDMQEIEFTIESGRLFMLQTRNGKRTPSAGLKLAVALVNDGIIDKADAVERCDMAALAPMLVSKVEPEGDAFVVAKGLPASPGAASAPIVFTSDDAVAAREAGKDVVLVRTETDPKDVHGMDAAIAILTSRGGMTSHAAVVARGMGKPCITAAMTLKIDAANDICSSMGRMWKKGDVFTLDGGSGLVYQGTQPTVTPKPDGDLAIMLGWRHELGMD